MKLLSDILYKSGIVNTHGETNLAVGKVVFDSREVDHTSLFVAVRGTQVDGHDFIDKAVASGAIAVVCEEFPETKADSVTYVQVKNSAFALGVIASNFYDNPSEKLKLIGITGTNGKTTTTTLLFDLFKGLGEKVGLISTVENRIGNEIVPSTHTTPDPVQLNALIAEMVEKGVKKCFMEVSSHAIDQHRIAGLSFDIAGFTNITHDHLDYHGTFDKYIAAKKGLFDGLTNASISIVNADDKHGRTMTLNTRSVVKTYGVKNMADYKAKVLENNFDGLVLIIDGKEVYTRLIGSFNASNLALVYAVAMELGVDQLNVLTSISSLKSVNGRFQHFQGAGVTAIVDYAHTPDALKNVLATITDVRTGNEQVFTVVGCGGNRDKAKRPVMADIASQLSDKVILTSDNPRDEEPNDIIEDMQKGVSVEMKRKVLSIIDRREAIRTACMLAKPGDIILVAGKGHEQYQEIKGVKHDFDDKIILQESLKTLAK